jgi:NDP-sugar pyrophosphorylase family protein
VELDDPGARVIQFAEKPVIARMINTGLYVLSPAILERVPREAEFSITQLIEDCLQRDESVGAHEVAQDWVDVGQRDQLKTARAGTSESVA